MQNYHSYNVGVDKAGRNLNLCSNKYGLYLKYNIPTDEYINDEDLRHFDVSATLPLIPAALWNSIISLFSDYAEQHLEVHVRVIQSLTQPNKFIALVPTQSVTGASAKYNYGQSIDLITGQRVYYPVDTSDYVDYLQIHSHNKMELKHPSSVDDEDELNKPGLYAVISNINNDKYTVCFTVTEHDGDTSKRYYVANNQLNRLVERLNESSEDTNTFDIVPTVYNPSVHNYIDKHIINHVKVRLPKLELFKKSTDRIPDNYEVPFAPLTLHEKLQLMIDRHGKEEVIKELVNFFHDSELATVFNIMYFHE